MIKVKIVCCAARDALSLITLPNGNFDRGRDLSRDRELALVLSRGHVGSRRWLQKEPTDFPRLPRIGPNGDRFDFGIEKEMSPTIAPNAAGNLFVDLNYLRRVLACLRGERSVEELAVVGRCSARERQRLVDRL